MALVAIGYNPIRCLDNPTLTIEEDQDWSETDIFKVGHNGNIISWRIQPGSKGLPRLYVVNGKLSARPNQIRRR